MERDAADDVLESRAYVAVAARRVRNVPKPGETSGVKNYESLVGGPCWASRSAERRRGDHMTNRATTTTECQAAASGKISRLADCAASRPSRPVGATGALAVGPGAEGREGERSEAEGPGRRSWRRLSSHLELLSHRRR